MKRLIAIPVLFVLVIVYWTVAKADHHTTGIKEAHANLTAALEAADVDAIVQLYHPSRTAYLRGGLLTEGFNKTRIKAWFDAGNRLNYEYRHRNYKVYGNTAVATYYMRQTRTTQDETTEGEWRRVSSIWIKNDDKWKMVHTHHSPLIIEPPVIIEPPDDDDDDSEGNDNDDDD